MADTDRHESNPVPVESGQSIPTARMMLLFTVMLVTAAGNTAMQSVMPSIGTALGVQDFWISLAYTWSALLWVPGAPLRAPKPARRGGKAMRALALPVFIVSISFCPRPRGLGHKPPTTGQT